jgi:hypothetical protein
MDLSAPVPKPTISESKYTIKKEFILKSNKNVEFNMKIGETNENELFINVESKDLIPNDIFIGRYFLKEIQILNKYFLTCENINDVLEEIIPIIESNIKLIEKDDMLILNIPIPSKKYPNCEFKIKQQKKTQIDLLEDSYKLISILTNENKELKNSIKTLNEKIFQIEKETKENNIKNKINSIIDIIYPIGTYYYTSENINPEESFGGKWEKITDRFLLGAGNKYSINSEGGEESHQLTIDEMPNHNHKIAHYGGRFAWGGEDTTDGPASGRGYRSQLSDHITGYIGGGKSHNNMPPYLGAYCWHRIG